MKTRTLLVAVGAALALIGIAVWGTLWILRQPLATTETEETPAAELPEASGEPGEIPGPVESGRVRVTLYVLGSSGRELATEREEIPYSPSLQEQAKEVVRLLLRRSGAIPRGVQLRELFVTSQGVAYIDLSQELVANHPGGSSAEELTVFSLTQTLVANFPAIQRVRILVEGREIQTLAGHLDLTIPYGRAPQYLQPVSERRAENQNEAD